jgi:flagellar basal body-associated protein FliL
MNNLKEKTKIYLTQRRSRVSVSGISIGFDWVVILVLTTLAVVGGAAYGYVLYRGVSTGSAFESAAPEGVEDYGQQREEIGRVVERLNAN